VASQKPAKGLTGYHQAFLNKVGDLIRNASGADGLLACTLQSAERSHRNLTSISRRSACQRQGEPESGALSDRALDTDTPAVSLDQQLADVQAQAQSAG
jgi:hypothetical protein